jgi:spore maturation protein CgeB
MKPTVAMFGSSLVSSYWNGAATYYRGLLRALAARGYAITFYEPDAYGRQQHRDIPDPSWAEVVVYAGDERDEGGVRQALRQAASADILIKASGVGVFDTLLDHAVLDVAARHTRVIYWDVDAPATLDRLDAAPDDPFHALVPRYDLVLTYGGGAPVVEAYAARGARDCVPVYNAVDVTTHHPSRPDARFSADLGLLANRLPDREARVDDFFMSAAAYAREQRFLLGGSGWETKSLPANVRYVGHVPTADHNAFNCTPRAVLNVSRDSMARYGFSPATRVFEAAAAGACLFTDAWAGIEQFLEPGEEIVVVGSGRDVADRLASLTGTEAGRIGDAARRRVTAHHTYGQRAEQLDALLDARVRA